MVDDLMTYTDKDDFVYDVSPAYKRHLTIFDVAALKDTNWYADVNMDMVVPSYWGKGKGCDFVLGSSCNYFPEFCDKPR